MTQLGWVGVWLLVVGGLAILVEMTVLAVWSAAMGNRARMLAQRLEYERGMLETDLEKLRVAIEEMQRLWQPYRKTLRWLRHPLLIALLKSYRRRVAAR